MAGSIKVRLKPDTTGNLHYRESSPRLLPGRLMPTDETTDDRRLASTDD